MRYVKRIVVLFAMLFFIPIAALAGVIAGEGDPTTNGGGAMNTLEDIYNLINLGTTNAPRTGIFAEPTAGPVATGHTLTQIYDRAKTSSRPARTGQTPTVPLDVTAIAGADGKLQKGVVWPSARFTSNSDNTVTDNLTGLMWAKNANLDSNKTWVAALSYCNDLTIDTYTDWRLPNRFELESLLDLAYFNPALSNDAGTLKWGVSGDGLSSFTGVQSAYYWSSTTAAFNTANYAWIVLLGYGYVNNDAKTNPNFVWPVRGGQ